MSLSKNHEKMLSKKVGYPMFMIIAFLFCFFQFTGSDLAKQENILWTSGYTLGTLAKSLCLGILLGGVLCFLLYRLAGRSRQEGDGAARDNHAAGSEAAAGHKGLKGIVCFLGIFLCWLPGYLAYYPAICAYDSPVQMGQIMDGYFIDHHPIAHTLIIKGCIAIGQGIFGSVTAGVGIYALLQMLLLAGAFTYGVMALERSGVKRHWKILAWIFCMVFPFQLYMSVSMTKDTVFTAFFILQMTALLKLLREDENSFRIKSADGVYFAAVIGMMLFRNNGKYAMLVLVAVQLLVLVWGRSRRRMWGRLFLNSLLGFLAGNLLLSGIFTLTGAEQGDRREMLSLPIQQLARTMIYHGGAGVLEADDNTMDDTDKALINDFILNNAYQYYRADLADPVKGFTNTYVPRYRPVDFIKTYLHLLTQYPGDFINAFLGVNAGYLYVNDVSHAYINEEEEGVGRGYVQTYWAEEELNERGLYKASKWEWLHGRMEQWADTNAYLKIPVLKYLFVPGTYLWMYLFLFAYLMLHKRFRACIPLALVFGYFITLLLGPTVQMRYIYPLMTVLPFVALLQGKGDHFEVS